MAISIGRNEAIGLGKESVAGTFVAASVWIPKKTGWMSPSFEEAVDDSGRGVIDEIYDSATVKNFTKVSLWGIVRDDFIWHLFLMALGTRTTLTFSKPTSVTGTPVRWGACYQGTNLGSATWTWVLKKILIIWANTYHLYSTVTGTFTTATTVKESTGSTWTAVTPDSSTYTAVKTHLFSRANTNTHQTYTAYSDSAIWAAYSPYCMIDSFKLSSKSGEFVSFESELMGKKMVSTTAQTPAYTDGNPFLSKHMNVYFAADEASLNAASATCLQSFNLNINKNLANTQCFGSDDVDKLYNQQFTVDGDLEAIYDSVTIRDYVVNSTKKAARISMINTGVTALVTGIYPSIYIDCAKLGFKEWTKSDDLNSILTQTSWFTGQYKSANAMSVEILLLNSTATY